MDDIVSPTPGLTVDGGYGPAKGLDPVALNRWGVTTEASPFTDPNSAGYQILGPPGTPCVAFRYFDLNGKLVRIKYRGQRGTVWDQRVGVQPILYGVWFLPRVPADRAVVLVEGESDSNAGWLHSVMALGCPGNSTWKKEWKPMLAGHPVTVWREPVLPGKKVDAGLKMCEMVAADFPNARVIQPKGVKDLCELHQTAGKSFSADLRALMEAARPIRDVVVPKPRKPDIRVWRAPLLRGPFDRDRLDIQKAKDVPLDQLMQRLGFDLKRCGSEYKMCCPFHEDGRPSLRINPAKGLWRCDPCDLGGDAITFMQKWRGLAFPDAVRAVVA